MTGAEWAAVRGFARGTLTAAAFAAGTSHQAVWKARRSMLVAPAETAGLLSVCHCAAVEPPPRCSTGEAVLDAMERRRLARALGCATWIDDSAQTWAERLLTEDWT